MRRFIILILLLFCILLPVVADDVDVPATGELWDNWNASQDFYGQDKNVSDEDFDKAIDSLKSKKNKRAERLRKKQIPKGEEFSQSNETELINEQSDKDSLPVVSIPVDLIAGEDVLPVGHYQVKCEKDGENFVLKLYQSHYLMAQFPAVETNDDFDEDTITFARWFPEGDDKIKIIYGSLDYNGYALINIHN